VERCLLNLYTSFVLDVDPMLKISSFENKSFLLDHIQSIDYSRSTGSIFYDNTSIN
jgi:hypothetical protein